MTTEKVFQVATWAVDGIGIRTYRLIEKYVKEYRLSWAEWWDGGPAIWAASGLKPHQQAALANFKLSFSPEAYFEFLTSKKIWAVTETEPTYPTLLASIPDRPPVLFGQGKLFFEPRAVAIVGTRQITSYGITVTQKLVQELVAAKVTIVSGFMYGVDAVAHQAAQRAGGVTIGVLGFGFEYMYPASQKLLFQRLLAQGQTFITEYAPHVGPTKGTFVCRNRLLAGLTQATVVTEAGLKSGSHTTARWAIEYGRSVCAVPGSIINPYSVGTKWLINQGAKLVDSAQDIFEELGWENPAGVSTLNSEKGSKNESELDSATQKIIQELKVMAQSVDQLVVNSGLPLVRILSILTTLELRSQVRNEGGSWSLS